MTLIRYTPGLLVTHPKKPEWGLGKVLDTSGNIVVVFFRDVKEAKTGEAVKRIDITTMPLSVAATQSDPWLDALAPLEAGRLPYKKPRVTPAESKVFFCQHFPNAFSDARYLINERNYKWSAHKKFALTLGDGKGESLLADGRLGEVVRHILAAERAVNLLSPFEKAAFADGLKDEDAALAYATALFDLLGKESCDQAAFDRLIVAVKNLPAKIGRARVATWPVLTVLPFLAQPTRFMFLKPDVTNDAAERLRWNLSYTAKINWFTYRRLLDMSAVLMTELLPLGARDLIDVQSFIWVTGYYENAKVGSQH